MSNQNSVEKEIIDQQRQEILDEYHDWTEVPGLILGLVWLILLVVDLVWHLNPFLNITLNVIWILFVIDFLIRFFLAPHKIPYLKKNWLTAIALVVPALRIFRIFEFLRILRVARAARGINMIRIFSSVNRGMRALRSSFGRRGFQYVMALTLIITLVGAAGMYAFEQGQGIHSYGEAVWWTAMIMTTMGSDYWPKTGEGRFLTLLLALYAFAIFGYITATLASFFVGREAEDPESDLPNQKMIRDLQEEVRALREDIQQFTQAKQGPADPEK